MSRVIITLSNEERRALIDIALQELRTPSMQAHYILREKMRELGLRILISENQKFEDLMEKNNQTQ
jgi:hypothetical protein